MIQSILQYSVGDPEVEQAIALRQREARLLRSIRAALRKRAAQEKVVALAHRQHHCTEGDNE